MLVCVTGICSLTGKRRQRRFGRRGRRWQRRRTEQRREDILLKVWKVRVREDGRGGGNRRWDTIWAFGLGEADTRTARRRQRADRALSTRPLSQNSVWEFPVTSRSLSSLDPSHPLCLLLKKYFPSILSPYSTAYRRALRPTASLDFSLKIYPKIRPHTTPGHIYDAVRGPLRTVQG